MYGAIIGDLAGSIYEFEQTKNIKNIIINNIIEDNAFYSDDTILTIAIADAIINMKDYEITLKNYIKGYSSYRPNYEPYFEKIFSPNLIKWALGDKEGTSSGNGALMRISAVGYLFDTEDEVIQNARLATIPSHNSIEAIQSVTTVALVIFYLRKGYSLDEIYQKLHINLEYKPFKKFNVTCAETINNCLYALYYSTSFSDAIRKAIYMGGDNDTNACIVGSMAEALFGIDPELIKQVNEKIPVDFVKILSDCYKKIK